VVRRCNGPGSEQVIIRLPDSTQCAVPEWMLDPGRRSAVTDQDQPVISVHALRRLAQLLDCQTGVESITPHEQQQIDSSASASISRGAAVPPATGAVACPAVSGSPAVPGTLGTDAHHRRQPRKTGGRR
jgi:hypothetical protein